VFPLATFSSREATLLDAQTYRRYAAECLRIASKMDAKDRNTLLEIAEAWEARAQEAERINLLPPKPKLDGGEMANN
jgi:hypothetical protein